MKKALLALLLSAHFAPADTATLDNGTASLEVNLQGGGITRFTLNDLPVNPFSWRSQWNPGCEGFFLCFDRIGQSSSEDKAKGIPLHGEAHIERWTVLEQTGSSLRVQCNLPLVKMSVVREYQLYPNSSVCRITDRFKNNNAFEKPYNILHHPSLGAPFLDPNLLVDCNASEGFIREKNASKFPGRIVTWPSVDSADLHRMKDKKSGVVNFRTAPGTIHGWAGIANPQKGLLVGYLWNTADYPWIRVWREWKDETPGALGVEFGTSPLAIPLEQIKKVGDIMGLPTICSLPPGGETEHTFYLFLAKIPADYSGTENIILKPDRLILEERGSDRSTIIQYTTTP